MRLASSAFLFLIAVVIATPAWAEVGVKKTEKGVEVTLDGQPVGMETLLTADDEKEYKLTATAKAGARKLAIEYTNDAYKENEYDRNFYVHGVTLKRLK